MFRNLPGWFLQFQAAGVWSKAQTVISDDPVTWESLILDTMPEALDFRSRMLPPNGRGPLEGAGPTAIFPTRIAEPRSGQVCAIGEDLWFGGVAVGPPPSVAPVLPTTHSAAVVV